MTVKLSHVNSSQVDFQAGSHVLRRMCDLGRMIAHRIALDLDPDCAEAYNEITHVPLPMWST